ncbi:MAG: insulinase family protein [Elusimicrobia bacterium]|nr:insulinase family protein [Elusimicrobiota bacterium]
MKKTGLLPKLPIKSFGLKNGLRVVVVEDHSAPVVTIAVAYSVGARCERPGRSGFAHLFEHMMFQGSKNVDKTGHMRLIESEGGNLNGFTTKDFTVYHETLPSNRLALGLWLEADRMSSLAITQENFDNQKDVVQEEKRWRYDNRPYMTALAEEFPKLLFSKWENQHSVIGSLKDLDEATVDDLREFFKTFYAPNNAVVTVVGDVKISDVKRLSQKYFGKIKPQPKPRWPDLIEKPMTTERRAIHKDPFAALPVLLAGWPAPAATDRLYKPTALLGAVLLEGEDSRLHQLLVKEKELALEVSGGLGWPFGSPQTLRDPSPFGLMAHLKEGVSPDEVLALIQQEIAAVARGQITEDEIRRARRKIQSTILDEFQGTETRCWWLGIYSLLHGGRPDGFEGDLNAYLTGVTRKMVISAAAAGYFDPNKRGVLVVKPAPELLAGLNQSPSAARPKETTQQTQGPREEPREGPPKAKGLPKPTPRPVKEFELANGLRVLGIEDNRLPFLKTRLFLPAAFWPDQEQLAAAGEALAELFKAGTKKKTSQEIETQLAAMGGYLGASDGHDWFSVGGSILSETAKDYFALLGEIAVDSNFPAKEVELWRANSLEEIKDKRTRPEFLREERWASEIFGSHPYSVISAKPETVRALSREDVVRLYGRQLNARGGFLVVVGDITAGALEKILKETLGKIPAAPVDSANGAKKPSWPGRRGRKVLIVDRPGSAQTNLALGHLTIKRDHPDYYALALFNGVLGVIFDSRLNRTLREEKGYTYGAGSSVQRFKETGVFKISTAVRTEVTTAALADTFKELDKILSAGLTDDELTLTKNYLAGSDAISQGVQESLADLMAGYEALGMPWREMERFRSKILGVTKSQSEEAGARHLRGQDMAVVAVGDAARIAGDLAAFGPVEIYNADGTKRKNAEGEAGVESEGIKN